jgi:hypothetical protein
LKALAGPFGDILTDAHIRRAKKLDQPASAGSARRHVLPSKASACYQWRFVMTLRRGARTMGAR